MLDHLQVDEVRGQLLQTFYQITFKLVDQLTCHHCAQRGDAIVATLYDKP